MERVGILVNKLQDQLKQQTEPHKMLVTAQMLYTELLQETQNASANTNSKVSVVVTTNPPVYRPEAQFAEVKHEEPALNNREPILNKEIEREPAEFAPTPFIEVKDQDVASNFVYESAPEQKKASNWAFNTAEIPTLAHQEKPERVVYELNDEMGDQASLNEKLKEEKTELGAVLHNVPIHDLKKAISINDRHRFIESLFRGDETMYERSIKTINNFRIFAEAEFWIQRELKLKLGWDTNLPEVKLFDHLVRRRFS